MYKRWLWVGGAVVLLAAVSVAGIMWYQTNRQILPAHVTEQLSYTAYYPRNSGVSVDRQSVTYSATSQVLIFSADLQVPKSTLVFTQQPMPANADETSFDFETMMLRISGKNHPLSTKLGTVLLFSATPNELSKTAAMNNQGTVVYIHSSVALSDDTWRQIFDGLEATQP